MAYFDVGLGVQVSIETEIQVAAVLYGCGYAAAVLGNILLLPRGWAHSQKEEKHRG
jgi:hypothetical protein